MPTLEFQKEHHYSRSDVGIEVPIYLGANGQRVRIHAKVDTGAAYCIFQRNYAEQLGIDVESGEYKAFQTVAGKFETYGHSVSLSCLDYEFDSKVYFAVQPEHSRNVVGRLGWLQHFRLAIVDHDLKLYLSQYDA